MRKLLFLFAAFLFLLSSCSLQKRHYLKGFYVTRKGGNNLSLRPEPLTLKSYYPENPEKPSCKTANEAPATATASKNSAPAAEIAFQPPHTLRDNFAEGCDTIVLVNGKKIPGKITEVNALTVKVKGCTGDSPTVTEIPKSQIAGLKFANGTSEKIDQAEVEKARKEEKVRTNEPNKGLKYSLEALLLALGGYASVLLILLTWNIYLAIIPMCFLAGAILFLIKAFKFFKRENTRKGLWLAILAMLVAIPLALICIGAITDILD
jgi:hypothetical protein